MTDGTSQGLFIVVAIVIFGIFVVLAYILFEDTLSPALANMFSEATEQTSNQLRGYSNIEISNFKALNQNIDYITFDFNRKFVENNEPYPSYRGEEGVWDSSNNAYLIRNVSPILGDDSYIDRLGRIYVSHRSDGKDLYNIVETSATINGKKVPVRLQYDFDIPGNYYRYFVVMEDKLTLEMNKVHKVKLNLYTDKNEVFTFEKSIIIK